MNTKFDQTLEDKEFTEEEKKQLQKEADESIPLNPPLKSVDISREFQIELGLELIRADNTVLEIYVDKNKEEYHINGPLYMNNMGQALLVKNSTGEIIKKNERYELEIRRECSLCQFAGFMVKAYGEEEFDNDRWVKKLTELLKPLYRKGLMRREMLVVSYIEMLSWDEKNKVMVDVNMKDLTFRLIVLDEKRGALNNLKIMTDLYTFEKDKLKYTVEDLKTLQRRRIYVAFVFPTVEVMKKQDELRNDLMQSNSSYQYKDLVNKSLGVESLFLNEGELPVIEYLQD